MKYLTLLAAISLSALAFNASNSLGAAKSVDQMLQEFDTNSAKFMDQLPAKWNANSVDSNVVKFQNNAVKSKDYINAKNTNRKVSGRSDIQGNDEASNLVDAGDKLVSNLHDMDKKKLQQAVLAESPWSDFYWPLYLGNLAYRFSDENFPTTNWKDVSNFFMHSDSSSVEQLSPAEKYDLLVGDADSSMKKASLAQGEEYFKQKGDVETWMGICHGWSPASFMMDRPSKAITVLAADGKTKIKFYPSDIKALASSLWATNNVETRFVGGRCNVKEPKHNASGRILDQDCFDSNPGTWHMGIVNQIGLSKRSFVMDATFDYEVWNQPVYGYNYTYFNPQTKKSVKSIAEASVSIDEFTKDKFKSFRSKDAATVVGVAMDVTYVVETRPTAQRTDSENADAHKTVQYLYDLELDRKGQIIGGEWWHNAHPDFMWTPTPKARALTAGDQYLIQRGLDKDGWDGKSAIPASWKSIAQRTAKANGSPLGLVVESLIQLSHIGK